jgi:hypothetical protein
MWNPLSWVMEAAAFMAIALANGGVTSLSLSLSLTHTDAHTPTLVDNLMKNS